MSPPRILFLPGAGADPDFWRPTAERLPADWDKTRLGWPGLGDQPPQAGIEGLDDLVGLVEQQMGAEPVDLVAQSMGGLVAMTVLLRNPGRVRRLVLTTTSAGVPMARLGAADWRDGYFKEHPQAAAWLRDLDVDLSARLAEVVQPALLIFGTADPISPPSVGEYLLARLPDARLQVIEGGEHDLAFSRADEVAALIVGHLA